MGHQVLSFVERFIVLCPYLGESTIGGPTIWGGGGGGEIPLLFMTKQVQHSDTGVKTCN